MRFARLDHRAQQQSIVAFHLQLIDRDASLVDPRKNDRRIRFEQGVGPGRQCDDALARIATGQRQRIFTTADKITQYRQCKSGHPARNRHAIDRAGIAFLVGRGFDAQQNLVRAFDIVGQQRGIRAGQKHAAGGRQETVEAIDQRVAALKRTLFDRQRGLGQQIGFARRRIARQHHFPAPLESSGAGELDVSAKRRQGFPARQRVHRARAFAGLKIQLHVGQRQRRARAAASQTTGDGHIAVIHAIAEAAHIKEIGIRSARRRLKRLARHRRRNRHDIGQVALAADATDLSAVEARRQFAENRPRHAGVAGADPGGRHFAAPESIQRALIRRHVLKG